MKSKVFQLLVDNTSGVLSRISGLFSRRGYNIESITAGVTSDPRYTRITIVTSGDDEILEQIEKQVNKLTDVRHIKALEPEESVYRELALVKVRSTAEQRQSIISMADIFRGKIIDVGSDSLIIELTGSQSKICLTVMKSWSLPEPELQVLPVAAKELRILRHRKTKLRYGSQSISCEVKIA